MPDRIACTYCGKVGFVRREHIVKAGGTILSFYCGSCNRSWEEAEAARAADNVKRPPNDKRERS